MNVVRLDFEEVEYGLIISYLIGHKFSHHSITIIVSKMVVIIMD